MDKVLSRYEKILFMLEQMKPGSDDRNTVQYWMIMFCFFAVEKYYHRFLEWRAIEIHKDSVG